VRGVCPTCRNKGLLWGYLWGFFLSFKWKKGNKGVYVAFGFNSGCVLIPGVRLYGRKKNHQPPKAMRPQLRGSCQQDLSCRTLSRSPSPRLIPRASSSSSSTCQPGPEQHLDHHLHQHPAQGFTMGTPAPVWGQRGQPGHRDVPIPPLRIIPWARRQSLAGETGVGGG